MISFFQAGVMGVLQGVTELFPVSSLGHSVILPKLLGWNIDQASNNFLIFIVATHFATALVLFLFFFKDWSLIIKGLFRSLKNRYIDPNNVHEKLGWLIIVATITIVEFSDLECPFCKMFHPTMQNVMNTYGKDGKVAWVYRHFPLDSIHPKTRKEAEATECANEQGGNTAFWKYTDEIYKITTSNNTLDPQKLPVVANDIGLDVAKFNTCLASGKYAPLIQSQLEDGIAAGAQGTPYSIMILKSALSTDKENALNEYIVSKGLAQNVSISSDKKEIALNGALPSAIVNYVIDAVLK